MVKHRILLADDSITIQKVVNLTFADEGIEVVAVGDGDAAMQKFVEAVPDLVMVDVNMPGADGYRICEMIKQDDETKHIPVILLVGSFEPFDEEEARRVGADDFLTKPFQSIRQLVNKVTDLLNGKRNASFGDEKNVSSFDDTLEMVKFVNVPEIKTTFDDAAMDDEMIQTNQIGSLPINETQKLESVPKSNDAEEKHELENKAETSEEYSILEAESTEHQGEKKEFESEIAEESANSEIETLEAEDDAANFENESSEINSSENLIGENPAIGGVLPEENQEEIELFPKENQFADESDTKDGDDEKNEQDDEFLPRHENIYEFANENEQEFENQQDESFADTEEVKADSFEVVKTDEDEEIPTTKEFIEHEDSVEDEEDLTDTSFTADAPTQETAIQETEKIEAASNFETTQEFALDDFDLLELPQTGKTNSAEKESIKTQISNGNLSPEDIEAIADRVVEKLSGNVIKEIVREVVLQTTKND